MGESDLSFIFPKSGHATTSSIEILETEVLGLEQQTGSTWGSGIGIMLVEALQKVEHVAVS